MFEPLNMTGNITVYFSDMKDREPTYDLRESLVDVLSGAKIGKIPLDPMKMGEILEQVIAFAKQKKENSASCKLSLNEIGAVALYTADFSIEDKTQVSFYAVLNKALASPERDEDIRPFTMYIWLLLNALKKCPSVPPGTLIYRGARTLLGEGYAKGRVITWCQFASFCDSAELEESDKFSGLGGPRTFFSVELTTNRARIISQFCMNATDKEIILPPNTRFLVLGKEHSDGLVSAVDLKELPSMDPILDFETKVETTPTGRDKAVASKAAMTNVPRESAQAVAAQQPESSCHGGVNPAAVEPVPDKRPPLGVIRDLTTLTVDEVITLLESLGVPGCEEAIKTNIVDGRTLSYVEAPPEFVELGLALQASKARMLFDDIQYFASSGVSSNIIKSLRRGPPVTSVEDAASSLRYAVDKIQETVLAERILEALPDIIGDDEVKRSALCGMEGIPKLLLSLVKFNMRSVRICEKGIAAVRLMCRLRPGVEVARVDDNTAVFSAAGACEVVIQALRTHISNPNVLQEALQTVINLTKYKENISKLCGLGTADQVVKALTLHRTVVGVVDPAFGVIACLAVRDEYAGVFMDAGVSAPFVKALTAHRAVESVVEASCRALMSLCVSDEYINQLCQDGICEQISRGLGAHRGSALISEEACRAITVLANGEANITLLCRAGACELIVQIMNHHNKDDPNVSEASCEAVMSLANSSDARESLCGAGACEAVVLTLRIHSGLPGVAEAACGAVWNLAYNEESITRLGVIGASELVVQALVMHGSKEGVAEWGCGAVHNLSFDATNKARLLQVRADQLMRSIGVDAKMPAAIRGLAREALALLYK